MDVVIKEIIDEILVNDVYEDDERIIDVTKEKVEDKNYNVVINEGVSIIYEDNEDKDVDKIDDNKIEVKTSIIDTVDGVNVKMNSSKV